MPRNLAAVPDRHDIDQINRDLIAEFAIHMDVAASTRAKYRAQLEELRVWLSHPRAGTTRSQATCAPAQRSNPCPFEPPPRRRPR